LYKRRRSNYKNNILPKKTDKTKKNRRNKNNIIWKEILKKSFEYIDKRYMNVYKK
jgi:hypothetical protein